MSIMHEAEWTKDGGKGCLMSLVKIGAVTVLMAGTLVMAYNFLAPGLVALWW